MKILNIKKNAGKYQIILENNVTLTTNDQVIINQGLLYKKKLSDKEIKKIEEETVYYENYNKVLKLLNTKMRSENEVRKYLKKNGVAKDDGDKMIYSLKEAGLINDMAYAEAYTNDKINLSLDGPLKIKHYLEKENIKEEYIDKALEGFTLDIINERISKVIDKRLRVDSKDTDYIFKQKLSLYLSNLGYYSEDVNRHLDDIKIDNSKLEGEMYKIYNRLKDKYSGYVLKNKLKQKLYAKGFRGSEIEDFIEKAVH